MRRPHVYERSAPRARRDTEQEGGADYVPAARGVLTSLGASPEPLCTRQLVRHVITAEGWDGDNARLRLTITHKVGLMMKRFERRGAVRKVGMQDRVTVWRLM